MTTSAPSIVAPASSHLRSYPRFLARALSIATDGGWRFYAWMTALTAIALVGANAWANQVAHGMILTNMTDHVSWGLYIANFTFIVGLAAGGVMMVIPAYLYRDEEMHDISIFGELLAIAALIMCMLFVTVDLGRPDRFWHLMPVIGRFNWPISMLTWDVVVISVYLVINLHIAGYLLYTRYLGRRPDPRWYVPFVFVSIAWAISIHTVTAFLYCGLGGRPLWNSALLAPRFLVSAFVSGPAFIIVTLFVLSRFGGLPLPGRPIRTLVSIVRITILISILMLVSELFTEFYAGGAHTSSARYLYFGLHGQHGLVPWAWSSVALTLTAAVLFLSPAAMRSIVVVSTACALAFVGVWIEKGMGLIIPGFIPGTLHEIVEYSPSLVEWKVTAGIWAIGLMVFTVACKVALAIFAPTGQRLCRESH